MQINNLAPINVIKKYGELVFLNKTVIAFSILAGAGMAVASLPFPYYVPFQFLLGLIFAHMVELQHETLHGALRWTQVNRSLGFLLGLPMLISYSEYQHRHMIHHENVGTPQDTEYFNYGRDKTLSLFRFFSNIWMFSHYRDVLGKIIKNSIFSLHSSEKKGIRKRIAQEYRLFLLIFFIVGSSSFLFETTIFLKLWVMPLFLFAAPIHFLMELPEHVFCERDNQDVLFNTRTIRTHPLMSWFVNGNNYHVEHHQAPHYPIALLVDLHQEMKGKIQYYEAGYWDFYKDFFKKIQGRDAKKQA